MKHQQVKPLQDRAPTLMRADAKEDIAPASYIFSLKICLAIGVAFWLIVVMLIAR